MDQENKVSQEDIVARSREISEERWGAIRAELEDSEDTAYLASENCPQLSRFDD
jgi:hypothetical protein